MTSTLAEAASPSNLSGAPSDTVASRFERQAAATPDYPAVVTDLSSHTYRQLSVLMDGIAATLVKLASPPARPIVLMIDDAPLLIAAMLGAAKAGRIFIPLELTPPKAWLSRVVADSGATHILADRSGLPIAQALAQSNVSVIDLEALPAITDRVNFPATISPDTACCILYTSGSTGRPKGVALTHRGLLHRAGTRSDRSGIVAGERIAHLRSGGFIAGKTNIFATLLSGACIVPFEIQKHGLHGFANWLKVRQITGFNITGSLFRAWLATLDNDTKLPDLRTIACGSEPLYASDIARIAQCLTGDWRVVHSCGATEIGAFASGAFGPTNRLEPGVLPVGRIVRGYDVWLENDGGRISGAGEVGEIVIKAPYLALGYWNQPELTAAAFHTDVADGMRVFRTGDLGRWRTDGQLEHLGRKDRKIKLRGHSIELYEVEFALLQLPGLTDAIVIVDETGPDDRRLIAYVAQASDWASRSGHALRAQLGVQLPAQMVPAEIIVLPSMPLTERGKIDRAALPPPPKPETMRRPHSRAPSKGMERDLARIWQMVLKIPDIGAEASFHDLGGTSLQAFQIFAKISQELGHDLPPTALVAAPTIAALAAKLMRAAAPEDISALVTFRAQGEGSPLFIVHHVFGDVLYARELSRHLKSDRPVYGLRPPPLDGSQSVPRTMEAIAAAYVAEIRRVHPKGPYCIAGYSFGGWMAFEMAQQLSRQGEIVSFLGLIDTHGKSAPTERETLGPRTGRHLRALCKGNAREIADYIKIRAAKNISYRLAVARLWLLPFLTKGLKSWIMRAPPYSIRPDLYARISRQAWRSYEPQPYAGPIAVISGKGRTEVHRRNWRKLAQGGLTIMEVPVGHAEMTQPHYSRMLAGCFDLCLEPERLSSNGGR